MSRTKYDPPPAPVRHTARGIEYRISTWPRVDSIYPWAWSVTTPIEDPGFRPEDRPVDSGTTATRWGAIRQAKRAARQHARMETGKDKPKSFAYWVRTR